MNDQTSEMKLYNTTETKLYKRGNAISTKPLIPCGEQVLICTKGMAPILDIFSNKESLNMGVRAYVVGMGEKVNVTDRTSTWNLAVMDNDYKLISEDQYKIGDEVVLGSMDDFAFKAVVIPNEKYTVNWYRKHESSPELIIANAVIRDKAKSKLALNNSEILGGQNVDFSNISTKNKLELFSNKDVEVVSYYLTNVHNLLGVYPIILEDANASE